MTSPFSIKNPDFTLPLIVDSPHSGRVYPADFGHACGFADLETCEDRYVDELYGCVPALGGVLLAAHFPRSYIDANRAVTDIDMKLIDGAWPYGPVAPTSRSDAGIGLIRRLVRPGIPVYDRKLKPEAVKSRIDDFYVPYHAALHGLIEAAHYNFGKVWHINAHSMPLSTAYPAKKTGENLASDFVLGDRDGTTCDGEFTDALRGFIEGMGYRVTVNDPFKGVELVRRYSNPARGIHSIQIEINQSLFMDERTGEKNENYAALAGDVEKLIGFCAGFIRQRLTRIAAD